MEEIANLGSTKATMWRGQAVNLPPPACTRVREHLRGVRALTTGVAIATTYAYLPSGIRVSKATDKQAPLGYVYAGGQLVDATQGGSLSHYLLGSGRILRQVDSQAASYYVSDAKGSFNATVSTKNGKATLGTMQLYLGL